MRAASGRARWPSSSSRPAFADRWSRRRWSPLQRGALEPDGWPCCSPGTPARGRGCSGLVLGEARASAKAKPGTLEWGFIPVRCRRCHRIFLVARRRAPRPRRWCRCWRLGLAVKSPWHSGAARTRPRVAFKPNLGSRRSFRFSVFVLVAS